MNLPQDTLSIVDNERIDDVQEILSPGELIQEFPLDSETENFITVSRKSVKNIVTLNDPRLLIVTGPCSIHDPEQALEVAANLKILQEKNPHLFIVMRTYFEKPRTTVGWKGLLNDPNLDGSFDIEKGLKVGRKLLLDINKMGVPCAVEFLDTLTPQYIADLVSWGAIGARTTESQEHRKLVSGLSMPVGFKNGTDGGSQIAIDAIGAAGKSHRFLSTTKQGKIAMVNTTGTDDSHIILRGGKHGTNYDRGSISDVEERLENKGVDTGIVVDFSHANSEKDHNNQPKISKNVAAQIREGNKKIVGVMIEANIRAGNQSYTPGKDTPEDLEYGVSITDACVDLETNEEMLDGLNEATGIRSEKNIT